MTQKYILEILGENVDYELGNLDISKDLAESIDLILSNKCYISVRKFKKNDEKT